ncbi:spore germination protein [Paenibacillus oenotherae]|uniref:Spore germination protein n=1 Tax=Paenibacillus oenotherae TaxID=1435645 RepID=A0ABS7D2D5_9BACL|nr:spore germination protein [Paenibacillus oenotherae]MBW7474100.1 spore germination protein [Paenibacillus oenotherae]
MRFTTEESSLQGELPAIMEQLKLKLGNSPDLIMRHIRIASSPVVIAAVIYFEGLIDRQLVNDLVLCSSLSASSGDASPQDASAQERAYGLLFNHVSARGEASVVRTLDGVLEAVLSGCTVLIVDGIGEAISCSTKGGESRGIEEPTTQVVIRGPKDSFNESLSTNIALIRRRIKNPDLWLEKLKLGDKTRTDVAIMYMKHTVDDGLVEEVKRRLQRANLSVVLETGAIEEMIQDQTATFFPTIYNTERPDVIAANLLEGCVAILVDGTPFGLLAPTVFAQFFQSPDDYYYRFDVGIFLRILRYTCYLISLLLPSVYIAAITFHQDMVPTTLLISIASAREGIPFPAFIEAMLMELSFEVLREAGVRMPRAMGQAVSIVGALVLGQAAVQAGIVSTAMVIVVSITGIASFSTPAYNVAIAARLIRLFIMVLAATLGFYGILLGCIVLLAHMCSLQSFGVPYMAPFAPFRLIDQKDTILRMPRWPFIKRDRKIYEEQAAEPWLQQQKRSGSSDPAKGE